MTTPTLISITDSESNSTSLLNIGGASVTLEYQGEVSVSPNLVLALSDGINASNPIVTYVNGNTYIVMQVNFPFGTTGQTFTAPNGIQILGIENGSVSYTGSGGQTVQVTTFENTTTSNSTICFCEGVLIATPTGPRAVETLAPGDLVTTPNGPKAVLWLGRQRVSLLFADLERTAPIRIRAGALGENRPARDLRVSPDHALLVEGVLVHAGALVNGTSILRETGGPSRLTYFHVELGDHSLIYAEGVEAETFIDNVDRMAFDNWEERAALGVADRPMTELAYPRAKSARQLPRHVRDLVAARAEALGTQRVAEAA